MIMTAEQKIEHFVKTLRQIRDEGFGLDVLIEIAFEDEKPKATSNDAFPFTLSMYRDAINSLQR